MKTYSVSEAAKELGVCVGTVYALCNRRRIRHERHGLGRGTIRIPEDAIEEYRKSVTVATEEGASILPPRSLRDVTYSGHEPS
jgi:excisionase family DNA binding protein